jgi:NADH:ubiquinone oxidoreductase subunit 4 (subunit M)
MFFGTIDNPKNEKLLDLSGREWLYMTPLVVLSLWIGCYPKTFMDYIAQPVNAVVRQVRPTTYQIPGLPAPAGARAPANPGAGNPPGVITIQK